MQMVRAPLPMTRDARRKTRPPNLKSLFCNLQSAITLLLTPLAASAQNTTLIPFEVSDQHDRVHRHTDYAGRIVVLIGSDREGSRFNDDWDTAIREALESDPNYARVAFLPVADVRGVPFFLKTAVKRRFPPEKENSVLLDWDGVFATTYGFEPNSTNMVIFGADGRLERHEHGRELDLDALSAIVSDIRTLLARP